MANNESTPCCEKFKTMIGGQALIEGIMMRGPEKDAIVVRGKDGLVVELSERKLYPDGSWKKLPFIRGVFNFMDSQVVGVKALMRSADLAPEEMQEEPSKFDMWLEKTFGNEAFQKLVLSLAVVMGVGFSVLLFFFLPMLLVSFLDKWITNNFLLNLLEGAVRMAIFFGYMFAVSHMEEMRRVFAYHGAEHKTIRCYEMGLELTVENVRGQTRLHPRCGTSFLLVVMFISILVFSVASTVLLNLVPSLALMRGTFLFRLVMIVFKLLMLPIVVSITYEINRWAGRNDNAITRILTAPGMWLQNLTTNEPDDSMIEVGIAAVKAVLPSEEGADRW